MILVLSFDYYEQGTDPVIDWLLYYKADFVKVSIYDLIRRDIPFKIDINHGHIYINKRDITDEINVIWYRRFEDNLTFDVDKKNKHLEQAFFEIQNEIEEFITYLKRILSDKIWMPCDIGIRLNKLEVIRLAQKSNILVPRTIITNSKSSVLDFQKMVNTKLIAKPIRNSSYFIDGTYTYSIYSHLYDLNAIEKLPDEFVLTLFQEYIRGEFEIRVFYLDGKFYASAIIVTKSEEIIDIKKHYNTKNIHWIPYQLPSHYEKKLNQFMKHISLNTGSLDILKTKDDKYVMLEINPVGQYSAPGYRCNYYLEEKIAKWLIKHDE